MSRNKRVSKGKEINPTFFVFCEGETEAAYICYLRSKYRLPVSIDTKIAGNRITEKYIENYKKNKAIHPKDKNYLMYDLDVPEMLERLNTIKNVTLLCSNPCFELWYLLHLQGQNTEITSTECIRKLKNYLPNYAKGLFDNSLKKVIEAEQGQAVSRASRLNPFTNPSSHIFELIEDMEEVQNLKK